MDGEKVGGVLELRDQPELMLKLPLHIVRKPRRIAARRTLPNQPLQCLLRGQRRYRRQVPGIDAVTIHRCLGADRLQPRPVQKGRQQRMMIEGLVEPRDGAGSALKRGEEGRVGR